jgi:hypothetical protein
VDQLHFEVYILFTAAYESYEFQTIFITSIKHLASIIYIKISEMKNSPTLRKIMGEKIMIEKLHENSFTIGLKLRTPKYLISLINFKLKICGIVNLLIFMDKEQVNKDCGFRLLRTKPLVRDDLLEVAMPVVGVGNINEINLQRIYFQSESFMSSLQQLFLENLKLSVEWDNPLVYLKYKDEWMFSGTLIRELLKMILSLYNFYDRMSYAFLSESYTINNIEDKNINLIKGEGTQIIENDGEVIGVHNVLSNEVNNLKKPPMIDIFTGIILIIFRKRK